MKLPIEITFRNVAHTEGVEERIKAKAAKLDKFFDNITSCRVVVESPHKHHHKGNTYHVRIELTVPGGEIVVNRDPQEADHEDMSIALRDAFNAAQRQLQAYAEKHNPSTSHSNMRITEVLGS